MQSADVNFIDFLTEVFCSFFFIQFVANEKFSSDDCWLLSKQFYSSASDIRILKRWNCAENELHHLAQWLFNSFRKENSTITHSKSRLMRNCFAFFLLSRLMEQERIWLKFPAFFHFRFRLSFHFADAFTFLDVRVEKKVDALCNRNINGAGNPPLGFRLLIACKSRWHQQGALNKGKEAFSLVARICIHLATFQELMLGNKQSGLLQKLGLNGRETNFNHEPIRFFKPTVSNLYSIGRKGKSSD